MRTSKKTYNYLLQIKENGFEGNKKYTFRIFLVNIFSNKIMEIVYQVNVDNYWQMTIYKLNIELVTNFWIKARKSD